MSTEPEPVAPRADLDRWEAESDEGTLTVWKYRYRMAMAWLHSAEGVLEAVLRGVEDEGGDHG